MQDEEHRPLATPLRALDARLLRFRAKRGDNPVALAEELIAVGRYGDASDVLDMALTDARGEDVSLALMLGRTWLMAGEFEKAQALLVQTARAQPNNKEVFRWLGSLLLKRGDPDRAIRVLDRAVLLDPRDAEIHSLHARAKRLLSVAQSVVPMAEPSVVEQLDEASIRPLDGVSTVAKAYPLRPPPPPPLAKAPTPLMKASPSGTLPLSAALAPPVVDEDDANFDPDEETLFYGSQTGPKPEVPSREWEEEPVTGVFDDVAPQAPRRAIGTGTIRGMPNVSESGRPIAVTEASAASDGEALAAVGRRDATDTGKLLGQLVREVLDSQRPEPLHQRPSTRPKIPLHTTPTENKAADIPRAGLFEQSVSKQFDLEPPVSRFENAPDDIDMFESTAMLDKATTEALRSRTLGDGNDTLRENEPPHAAKAHHDQLAAWPDAQAMERNSVPFVASRLAGGLPRPASRVPRSDVAAPPRQRRGARPAGHGLGVWITLFVLVALGVGGYFGWMHWQNQNYEKAVAIVGRARTLALRGDAPSLRKAETELRHAMKLSSGQLAPSGNLLLFVQMQRALEEGYYDINALRLTVRTLGPKAATAPYRDASLAVIYALAPDGATAQRYLSRVLDYTATDPALAYVVGRLKQRAGDLETETFLRLAAGGAERFSAAELAFVPLFLDRGAVAVAEQIPARVLASYPGHLRAWLWSLLVRARDVEPQEVLAAIERESGRLSEAAPTDRFLAELIRIRMHAVGDDRKSALLAMDRAAAIRLDDPILMALLATWEQRLGTLDKAEHTINQALKFSPENASLKRRLLEIRVQQGKPLDEFDATMPAGFDSVESARLRTHAALLTRTLRDLERVGVALDGFAPADVAEAAEVRALKVRVEVALGQPPQPLLQQAQGLVEQFPKSQEAATSLLEAALAANDPQAANRGIGMLQNLAPDDALTHFLRARVLLGAGQFEDAERAVRKSLELLPGYEPARVLLAEILIDGGRFEEADRWLNEGGKEDVSSGRLTLDAALNRVRVALGLKQFDRARQIVDLLTPEQRSVERVRLASAKIALAEGKVPEGLAEITPLAEAPEAGAPLLAVYGDLLLASGWMGRAAAAYRRALEKRANLPEALLGQAEVELRATRSTSALAMLARAETALAGQMRPEAMRARLWMLKGRAYLLQGPAKLSDATSLLRRATQSQAAPAESFFWFGEALSSQSSAQAADAYKRYLELDPSGSYVERAKQAIGALAL
ncbi:MAG: tetratricopeptide repeat protein [Myxococcales bacterium]|nr:tetratricopeptide repeat protein [Myxococcales bacterium]